MEYTSRFQTKTTKKNLMLEDEFRGVFRGVIMGLITPFGAL